MARNSSVDELSRRMDRFESILMKLSDEIKGKTPPKDDGLTETERRKISSILDNFDFTRVHRVMEALNWVWAYSTHGVPTIEELKREARRLLMAAAKEKTCVGTGGFKAVYEAGCQGDPDPYIGLEFIAAEYEGFAIDGDDDENGADDMN